MDLSQITAPIKAECAEVEIKLETVLKSFSKTNKKFSDILNYILSTPGKRLRPILTLLSYTATSEGASKKKTDVIHIATALEMLHMASLVHDDIIDHADLRHNKPSINAKWGYETALPVGILIYSKALHLISSTKNFTIISKISETLEQMSIGELFQVVERNNFSISIPDYIKILEGKTGALFGAACYSGAYFGNPELGSHFEDFGKAIGILFQIIDDYMDLIGASSTLKKRSGQDFELGEITLPLLLLLGENLSQSLRSHILHLLKTNAYESMIEVKNICLEYDIHKKLLGYVNTYSCRAKQQLRLLPDSQIKQSFFLIVDAIPGRIQN